MDDGLSFCSQHISSKLESFESNKLSYESYLKVFKWKQWAYVWAWDFTFKKKYIMLESFDEDILLINYWKILPSHLIYLFLIV